MTERVREREREREREWERKRGSECSRPKMRGETRPCNETRDAFRVWSWLMINVARRNETGQRSEGWEGAICRSETANSIEKHRRYRHRNLTSDARVAALLTDITVKLRNRYRGINTCKLDDRKYPHRRIQPKNIYINKIYTRAHTRTRSLARALTQDAYETDASWIRTMIRECPEGAAMVYSPGM